MSIQITASDVDAALAKMQGALDAIGGKKAQKIIANAINQSLAAGRKEAAREARKRYTAPFKKLFDNIDVTRARGSNLQGALTLAGRPGVSLIHFKAQPNTPAVRPKSGVTAQARKGGPRRVWQKSGASKPFIMKKQQGGFGVFVRRGQTKFEMLLAPSPIQAIQRQEAQEHVCEKIEGSFAPRLTAEIDRALASMGGR